MSDPLSRKSAPDLREALIRAVERHLRENDACGVGPLSDDEYRGDAEAIVTTVVVIQERHSDA